jgi:hypothetical protein
MPPRPYLQGPILQHGKAHNVALRRKLTGNKWRIARVFAEGKMALRSMKISVAGEAGKGSVFTVRLPGGEHNKTP